MSNRSLIGLRPIDGSRDYHRECRRERCSGVAVVQLAYAPDTGWHWLRCDKCGDEWNPGGRQW